MIDGHLEIQDGCHIQDGPQSYNFFSSYNLNWNISYIMVDHIVLPKMLEITSIEDQLYYNY